MKFLSFSQTKILGSSLALPANGLGGSRATSISVAHFALQNTKFGSEKEKLMANKKERETGISDNSQKDISSAFELLDKVKMRACNLRKLFKKGDDVSKRDLLTSLVSNCYIGDKKYRE